MGFVQNDINFRKALSSCSPRIVEFLNRLNEGEKLKKDWVTLYSDGSGLRVVDSLRTGQEQRDLFRKGRSVESVELPSSGIWALKNPVLIGNVVTSAWSGQSYHNYGLAVDVVFRKWGYQKSLKIGGVSYSLEDFYRNVGIVELAESCGLSWGGSWGDVVHFEDRNYMIPITANLDYMGFKFNENWKERNFNFDWICKYNGIDSKNEKKLSVSSLDKKKKVGFLLALLCPIALFLGIFSKN